MQPLQSLSVSLELMSIITRSEETPRKLAINFPCGHQIDAKEAVKYEILEKNLEYVNLSKKRDCSVCEQSVYVTIADKCMETFLKQFASIPLITNTFLVGFQTITKSPIYPLPEKSGSFKLTYCLEKNLHKGELHSFIIFNSKTEDSAIRRLKFTFIQIESENEIEGEEHQGVALRVSYKTKELLDQSHKLLTEKFPEGHFIKGKRSLYASSFLKKATSVAVFWRLFMCSNYTKHCESLMLNTLTGVWQLTQKSFKGFGEEISYEQVNPKGDLRRVPTLARLLTSIQTQKEYDKKHSESLIPSFKLSQVSEELISSVSSVSNPLSQEALLPKVDEELISIQSSQESPHSAAIEGVSLNSTPPLEREDTSAELYVL